MVVFTCNGCGDSLQKPKVAKHFQFQCRSPIFLTCVDCLKDFRGDEYVAHTKCVTENQRYGGKDFVQKPSANKGEKKQQAWIDVVQNVLSNSSTLTVPERNLLNSISKHENIPRKKAKFLNFIKSLSNNRVNMTIVETVWDKMEKAFKEATAENKTIPQKENINKEENQNDCDDCKIEEAQAVIEADNAKSDKKNKKSKKKQLEAKENDIDESSNTNMEENQNDCDECKIEAQAAIEAENAKRDKKNKKSKKRQLDASENEIDESSNKRKREYNNINGEQITAVDNGTDKFSWRNTILEIVATKEEISLKKLKKKVITQYLANFPSVTADKATSKFEKKLPKVSDIIISENKVRLASS